LARSLGFFKFIKFKESNMSLTEDEKKIKETGGKTKKVKNKYMGKTKEEVKTQLLEDTYESFCGCLEEMIDDDFDRKGMGHAVIYQFCKTQFDKLEVSLLYDDIYDSKTMLKQDFDVLKKQNYELKKEYLEVFTDGNIKKYKTS